VRTTSDLSDHDLASVLRAVRLEEDVRARALRVADVKLRDVTVACADAVCNPGPGETARLAPPVIETVGHGRALETFGAPAVPVGETIG